MKTMSRRKHKKFHYKNKTVDFLFNIIRLKNVVIKAQQKEIDNLRNLVTGRLCEKK